MARALILAPLFIAVAGCSHREEIPRITQAEWDEVRRHFPSGDRTRDEEYFASAEGRRIVAKRLRNMFGDSGLSTMRGATRVEVFRIVDTSSHPSPRYSVGGVEGFPIISKGRELGRESASKLAEYLSDAKLYFQYYGCWTDPGVAFRLWDGESSVTLVVCYECDHIDVKVRNARGRLVHESGSYYGDPFGGPDFLREVAKQAFPSDAEIQAL